MAGKRYTADKRKDNRFSHIRELWDTFNRRYRELYRTEAHATINKMLEKTET